MQEKIKYINRATGAIEEEMVAGEQYLRWLYSNPLGMGLLELIVKRGLFSYLYGKLQDTHFSKRKIQQFVKQYEINMDDYQKDSQQYHSFNDFFYRELKEGARPLDENPHRLIAAADGRLLAFGNLDTNEILQVKGSFYTLSQLIGDQDLAQQYDQGTCIVIRLCPTDYHRFHFPDEGIPLEAKKIKGHYYSVNPIALKAKARIYCENKREITTFQSQNFGEMLFLEVGATCVGSIIQTFVPHTVVAKGAEKGFFKFGGSTVIMFLQKGMLKIDEDILENTKKGYETKVKMGEGIGESLK